MHRRIHTGVMPYICLHCGKKFRYKVTQRTHKCAGRTDGAMEEPEAQGAGTPLSSGQSSVGPSSPLASAFGGMPVTSPVVGPTSAVGVFRQSGVIFAGAKTVQPASPTYIQETGHYSQNGSPTMSSAFSLARDPTGSVSSPHGGVLSAAVPPEIRQHLLKFRRAQGRRPLGHRLQHILER